MKRWLWVALVCAAVACEKKKKSDETPKPTQAGGTASGGDETECEGDCLPVPEGIAGTVFGMKSASLKDVFGRLKTKKMRSRMVTAAPGCQQRKPPPGTLYQVATKLGGEKARCTLLVLDDEGLASINCDLSARRSDDDHAEIAWVIYKSLAKQYGVGTLSDQVVAQGRLTANWESEAATLSLRAFRRGSRSSIALENKSSKYVGALVAEKVAIEEACAARAAAAEATKEARAKRLRDKAAQFERDLRPPLEKPKD